MNQGAVLHKGLLLDCKVCNPPTETEEKRERRKRRGPLTLDMVVRRQVAYDLGEEEPKKDERFQLLQKYGVAAPRIDRLATKPNWMGVAEWKRKQNEWYKLTKGLVAPQQRRQFAPNVQRVRPSYPRQGSVQPSLQANVGKNPQSPRFQRTQETGRPIWNNAGGKGRPSSTTGQEMRRVQQENRKVGDRP